MRNAIIAVAAFILGAACGGLRSCEGRDVAPREIKVLTRIDTVTVARPVPTVITLTDTIIERVAVEDVSGDSASVSLPRTQSVYEDRHYTAYVSGYKASLDSLRLYCPVTTSYVAAPAARKQPRFSIGLQAGYGITPRGFQPYMGVGVSVNLASF